MFNKLLLTALLSILVLGQGAVSVPQEVPRTCGGPYGPEGTICCVPGPVPVFGTPQNLDTALARVVHVPCELRGERWFSSVFALITSLVIWVGSLPLRLELVLRVLPPELHRGRHRAVLYGEHIKRDVNPLEAFESGEQRAKYEGTLGKSKLVICMHSACPPA
ncbi:hypothetical protein B0H13DRAFT_2268487 [Mycena leptocephala]|nr:hypothetical protein B0H13DRAFT_2268487 [Mycena leptocephala]